MIIMTVSQDFDVIRFCFLTWKRAYSDPQIPSQKKTGAHGNTATLS